MAVLFYKLRLKCRLPETVSNDVYTFALYKMYMQRIMKLFAFAILLGSCAPRPYRSPDMKHVIGGHNTIAILPPSVHMQLRHNQMNRTSPEQLAEMERKLAYEIQDNIYSWMLRKRRSKYSVNIEDIAVTNAKLKDAGIDYKSLWDRDAKEISKLLSVDGMVDMDINTQKPMSDGAAIALYFIGFNSITNHTHVITSVRDGATGNLLWRMTLNADGGVGSSPGQLTNYVMKKAARRFPYRRKN
jgi:hypothetical protein